MDISLRASQIQPSATLAITAKAKQLKKAGQDIISLAAGEPGFHSPEPAKQAAIKAIMENQSKYTPVGGLEELKEAIVDYTQKLHPLSFHNENVLISCGAKHSIFNALLATLNPGDEVILFSPYWVSYPEMIKLCGATPVIVETKASCHFQINEEGLRKALNPQTKLIIINSPNNPSGGILNQESLENIAKALNDFPNCLVLSDDIYESIRFDEKDPLNVFDLAPELFERGMMVSGASKVFAMTGWRLGWSIGPSEWISAMSRIQSQSTSNPSNPAQYACLGVMNHSKDFINSWIEVYRKRRDRVLNVLDELDIFCPPAEGAFYVFPDFSSLIKKKGWNDATPLAMELLNQAKIATVPGAPFGAPMHLRISYVCDNQELDQALDRLVQYVKENR